VVVGLRLFEGVAKMKIEEIERTLPNGFHDAVIERIDLNYLKREAKLYLNMQIQNCGSGEVSSCPINRTGIITLSELLFCIIEPPDPQYPYQSVEGLWITSSGPTDSIKTQTELRKLMSEEYFTHYFFVSNLNAFIYIAAKDARFEWI
jgi:hypothetical protein